MFKIIALFVFVFVYKKAVSTIYVRVGILLTCGEENACMHDASFHKEPL
jgi:hypothetical protein